MCLLLDGSAEDNGVRGGWVFVGGGEGGVMEVVIPEGEGLLLGGSDGLEREDVTEREEGRDRVSTFGGLAVAPSTAELLLPELRREKLASREGERLQRPPAGLTGETLGSEASSGGREVELHREEVRSEISRPRPVSVHTSLVSMASNIGLRSSEPAVVSMRTTASPTSSVSMATISIATVSIVAASMAMGALLATPLRPLGRQSMLRASASCDCNCSFSRALPQVLLSSVMSVVAADWLLDRTSLF